MIYFVGQRLSSLNRSVVLFGMVFAYKTSWVTNFSPRNASCLSTAEKFSQSLAKVTEMAFRQTNKFGLFTEVDFDFDNLTNFRTVSENFFAALFKISGCHKFQRTGWVQFASFAKLCFNSAVQLLSDGVFSIFSQAIDFSGHILQSKLELIKRSIFLWVFCFCRKCKRGAASHLSCIEYRDERADQEWWDRRDSLNFFPVVNARTFWQFQREKHYVVNCTKAALNLHNFVFHFLSNFQS